MSAPKPIGGVIKEALIELGLEDNYSEATIIRYWNELYEGKLSGIATVSKFKKGKLTMATESSTWRYELKLRGDEIKKLLNEKLGKELIREIVFK